MPETTSSAPPPPPLPPPPPPPPPPAAVRRLERPSDAPLRGVCAGLAEATGTDAVLWRVLFVVAALFGGTGVVLYLLGIVVIPAQDQERSLGERLLRGPDRRLTNRQALLLAVTVTAALLLLSDTDGLLVALALGGLAYLTLRSDRPAPAAPVAGPPAGTPMQPLSAAGAGEPAGAAGAPGGAPPSAWAPAPAWAPPPRPVRPRSPLTGPTLSLATLVAAVLVLLGRHGDVPAVVVLAAALCVVGLGLLAGSFLGRAPLLVLVALLLGLALAATAAAQPALDDGVGDRRWVVTPAAGPQDLRLGVGDATLDLTAVTGPGGDALPVSARVGTGRLLVLLPAGLTADLTARVGLGELVLDAEPRSGRRVSARRVLGPPGPADVRLELSVGTGQVEVRRAG